MIESLLKLTTTIAITATIMLVPQASEGATTTVVLMLTPPSFNPPVITINVGDTVNWVNGNDEHTVTGVGTDQDQFCGSGLITTCSETFNTAGSFPYECTRHAACCNMTGLVVVLAPVVVAPTITTQPLSQT